MHKFSSRKVGTFALLIGTFLTSQGCMACIRKKDVAVLEETPGTAVRRSSTETVGGRSPVSNPSPSGYQSLERGPSGPVRGAVAAVIAAAAAAQGGHVEGLLHGGTSSPTPPSSTPAGGNVGGHVEGLLHGGGSSSRSPYTKCDFSGRASTEGNSLLAHPSPRGDGVLSDNKIRSAVAAVAAVSTTRSVFQSDGDDDSKHEEDEKASLLGNPEDKDNTGSSAVSTTRSVSQSVEEMQMVYDGLFPFFQEYLAKWQSVWMKVIRSTLKPLDADSENLADPFETETFRICDIDTTYTNNEGQLCSLADSLGVEKRSHYRPITRTNMDHLTGKVVSASQAPLLAFLNGCVNAFSESRRLQTECGFSRNIQENSSLGCVIVRNDRHFAYLMVGLNPSRRSKHNSDAASEWSSSHMSSRPKDHDHDHDTYSYVSSSQMSSRVSSVNSDEHGEEEDVVQVGQWLDSLGNVHMRWRDKQFSPACSTDEPLALGTFRICDPGDMPGSAYLEKIPLRLVCQGETRASILRQVAREERNRLKGVIEKLGEDTKNTVQVVPRSGTSIKYVVFFVPDSKKYVYLVVNGRSRSASSSSTSKGKHHRK